MSFTVTLAPTKFGPYPAQVQQFLARAGLTAAQEQPYIALITKLVDAGVWSLLDALWIFAAPNSTTALLNLINANFTAVTHGTETFTANAGYVGDGSTGYIDTGFNPSSVSGVNYSLNSASLGMLVTGPLYSSSQVSTTPQPGIPINTTPSNAWQMFAVSGAGTPRVGIFNAANAGTYFACGADINDNGEIQGPAVDGAQAGFLSASRTNSAALSMYWNGNVISAQSAIASSGLPISNIAIGGFNQGGTVVGFTTAQVSAAFVGGGLTDAQMYVLVNAINTFCQNVGQAMWPISLTGSPTGGVGGLQWSNLVSESNAFSVPKFGINAHPFYSSGAVTPTVAQQVQMLQYLGVTDVRINAVDWAAFIEPTVTTPPTYQFPYDSLVQALRAAGLTVTLVMSYSNAGYSGSPYLIDGYFTAPTTSAAINAFSAYCAAVANHYGATGFIYEIWNEANIGQNNGDYAWSPAASSSPWANPAASIAAYVALWNAASAAIISGITFNGKTIPGTPGAIITSTGLAGGGFVDPGTWLTTFLADASLTNLSYCAYHPYPGAVGGTQEPEWSAFGIMNFINSERGTTPVCINECGAETQNCNNSEVLKAVTIVRGMLAIMVNGPCINLMPYELVEESDNYGFFDTNFNPLPSAQAYKNLIAAFAGATATTVYYLCQYAGFVATGNLQINGFFFIVIQKSPTSFVVIAWSVVGTYNFTYQIGAGLVSYSATDIFGNTVPVSNNSGNLSFPVSDIAGPVLLTYTT